MPTENRRYWLTRQLDLASGILVVTLMCAVGEITVQLWTVRIPCVIGNEIKVCVDRLPYPAQPEVPHSIEGSTGPTLVSSFTSTLPA